MRTTFPSPSPGRDRAADPRRVLIGLGSNVEPEENLRQAAKMLGEHWPAIRFSSVYRTAPREYADQPDFLNAAAVVETDESPEQILAALGAMEQVLGKSPSFRFGPRTIDLDLLLYGEEILPSRSEWGRTRAEDELTVPHPRLHERRFVLEPLRELMGPGQMHPALAQPLSELLRETKDQRCERTQIVLP